MFPVQLSEVPAIGILMASYTGPVDALKNILTTIAAAVGVILAVYGGIKFAMAFKNHDNQGEQSAIYTLVAAGILIALGTIIPLLTG